MPGRDHAVSGPAVDGAAGAKRNDEGWGFLALTAILRGSRQHEYWLDYYFDRTTTRHAGYAVNQKKRKRIEECFGWLKTIAMMRGGAASLESAKWIGF